MKWEKENIHPDPTMYAIKKCTADRSKMTIRQLQQTPKYEVLLLHLNHPNIYKADIIIDDAIAYLVTQ